MKKFVLLGLMMISSLAFARRGDWTIRYQCVAVGSSARGAWEVQGWQRDSVGEARRSALRMCRNGGLRNCRVQACYERIQN